MFVFSFCLSPLTGTKVFSSLRCHVRVSPAAPICGPSSFNCIFLEVSTAGVPWPVPLSLSMEVPSEGLPCGVDGWFT